MPRLNPWLLSIVVLLTLLAVAVWWELRHRRAIRALQSQLDELVRGRREAFSLPRGGEALGPLVRAFEQAWQLQQADMEAQKRLVADASHQLRTPLAVLRTQLQSVPSDPWVSGLLQTVDRATAVADEWLMRLKIEQRSRELGAARLARDWPVDADAHAHGSLQTASLDEVAREAALEFAPLIAKRGLQFSLDAVSQAVAADAWMLGELVRNLLANAIRHTPDGGSLGIVVRAGVQGPEVVVWDQGQGIADDDRERLFEPFAAATGGTGVGLGLSICRQLATAMRAEVRLFNRSDGDRVVGVDAVVRWSRGPAMSSDAEPPSPGDALARSASSAPVELPRPMPPLPFTQSPAYL